MMKGKRCFPYDRLQKYLNVTGRQLPDPVGK